MGRFSGLVSELERCGAAGQAAFEQVSGAGTEVCAAELAELVTALAGAGRAVQAASVAAVAQFARREEVEDPQDVAALVERVHGPGFVQEFAGTELALVLGVSTRSADSRVGQASALAARLPAVLARVAQGLVELGQAQRVLYETDEIDSLQDCHAVDAFVAARIGSCDPTRLGTLTRYAIGRICPQALRERADRNRTERFLDVGPGPVGMGEVRALVPAAQAAAIWASACELARVYQQDDPSLGLEQARADAFVDLVLGNASVTARVDLGVSVLSSSCSDLGDTPDQPGGAGRGEPPVADPPGVGRDLVSSDDAAQWDARRDVDHDPWYARHHDDQPDGPASDRDTSGTASDGVVMVSAAFGSPGGGECAPAPAGSALSGVYLPKVGYVPPDVVAGLVAQVGTQIGLAILDASTGTLLHTVREAYRPDPGMRHFITIRDGRCRMFGCQLRAEHWDLDHAIAHPRGATTPANLAGLCRRHHRAKQHRRWRYHLLPDGTATWQSPTGAVRVTHPEHHLPRPPDPPPPDPRTSAEPATSRHDDDPPF